MKKAIAAILSVVVGLFGFAIVDKDYVTNTESQLKEDDSIISSQQDEIIELKKYTIQSTAKEKYEKINGKSDALVIYSMLMNKAKNDAPGYECIRWQELPDDADSRVISKGGTLLETVLKLAADYLTEKEYAYSNPNIYDCGSDMEDFPIKKSMFGCLENSPNCIKDYDAYYLDNGNVILNITFNESCDISKIFNVAPKNEIDEILQSEKITGVFKEISYNYAFHECSVEMIFDPETYRINDLLQVVKCTISGEGKAVSIPVKIEKQELIDTAKYCNFEY